MKYLVILSYFSWNIFVLNLRIIIFLVEWFYICIYIYIYIYIYICYVYIYIYIGPLCLITPLINVHIRIIEHIRKIEINVFWEFMTSFACDFQFHISCIVKKKHEYTNSSDERKIEFLRTFGIDPWTRKRRPYLHLLPLLSIVIESAKIRNVTRSSIFVYLKRQPSPATLLISAKVRKPFTKWLTTNFATGQMHSAFRSLLFSAIAREGWSLDKSVIFGSKMQN